MKKTLQSKLTAALFAAAISTSGGTLSPQLARAADAADDVTTVPQTTYGPPVWMMTTDESDTTTTTATTEMPIFSTEAPTVTMTTSTTGEPAFGTEAPTVTMTTTTEELQLAGEPVLYDEPGDVNMNGSIDVRDLTLLKQYLLNQSKYQVAAGVGDLNGDGKIDKKDVQALIRLLTGKPEGEEEKTSTDPSNLMTMTTTIGTTTCVLYGPPPAY
ncbi:MAG: dockerin type I repeat-containing protein [Oscillospiraceae bacterium]|nr:dockerin type I repeat-containing protein [Oscillospiraceae bacterium]